MGERDEEYKGRDTDLGTGSLYAVHNHLSGISQSNRKTVLGDCSECIPQANGHGAHP